MSWPFLSEWWTASLWYKLICNFWNAWFVSFVCNEIIQVMWIYIVLKIFYFKIKMLPPLKSLFITTGDQSSQHDKAREATRYWLSQLSNYINYFAPLCHFLPIAPCRTTRALHLILINIYNKNIECVKSYAGDWPRILPQRIDICRLTHILARFELCCQGLGRSFTG